ncbi:MAG TPA: glycosyltransferase family 2 protein [Pyrinomonadaceae bacterium]|nr:glycosyltransferase family 2 protein [Pyrinomonadaceae bacterium]
MNPELSIVVPAFDEEERLGSSVRGILQFLEANDVSAELIVVDDGSRDQTSESARESAAEFPGISTSVIRYDVNRGKGFAVKTGLLAAKGEIALFSDADLSTPIDEMYKLLEPIKDGNFDLTFGSRALDRSLIGTHQPWRREQGGKVMNLIIRMMSGLPFFDTQCGFKAFRLSKFRPLLDLMTINRFGFDVEFLFVADHHGLRLKEIPVRWNNVEGSKVSVIRDTRRMFAELAQIRRNARQGAYEFSQE